MSDESGGALTVREREVHLRDYWRIVWEGRYTCLAVFAVVLALTTAWTFLQTPQYRSTATVEVRPQARRLGPGQDVSGLGMTGYGWLAEERFQNTQLEIVRSRAVTERAFRALGLQNDPRFAKSKDPVASFGARIKVAPRRETGLLEITVEGPDREEITRWANAVADAYVQRNIDRARDNARTALDQLRELMTGFQKDVTNAEKGRVELLKKTEIYSPDNQQAIVRLRLEKLNGELAQVQIELGRLGALLQKISDIQANDGDPTTVPDLQQDAVLQEMYRKRVQLESELGSLRVTYLPGAPQYLEKESEVERVKRGIRDQISTILARIQNQHDLAKKNEASLKARIQTAENEAFKLGLATSEYDVAKTDADTKQQLYTAITKTMNEVSVSAELLSNNVSILDRAVPPVAPFKPSKMLNLFLGGMFGVLMGLSGVFFLDYLDTSLRNPEEIQKHLGLSTLAVVPRYAGGVVSSHAVKEAFQSLRTSLVFSSANRKRRVVLVASTVPQEGKSSTLAHLSRTFAGAGDRVLVIDCDLRRPTQHTHHGIPREPGLTSYLVGADGMEDWRRVARTDPKLPGLSVIPCGPIPPNPPELLGSDRFRAMIREASEEFDWILLDSPPAASLSDAVLLASLADLVVLVVRHNSTDRDLITRAVNGLRGIHANVVGVVLNDVNLARAYKKDQYYAGYYYYGVESEQRPSKSERKSRAVGTGT